MDGGYGFTKWRENTVHLKMDTVGKFYVVNILPQQEFLKTYHPG